MVNFATAIQTYGAGNYTVTVVAKGTGSYTNSFASVHSTANVKIENHPINDLALINVTWGQMMMENSVIELSFSNPSGASTVSVQYTKLAFNGYTNQWVEMGWNNATITNTSTGDITLDGNDTNATIKLPESYGGYRVKLMVTGGSKAGESNIIDVIPPIN